MSPGLFLIIAIMAEEFVHFLMVSERHLAHFAFLGLRALPATERSGKSAAVEE